MHTGPSDIGDYFLERRLWVFVSELGLRESGRSGLGGLFLGCTFINRGGGRVIRRLGSGMHCVCVNG